MALHMPPLGNQWPRASQLPAQHLSNLICSMNEWAEVIPKVIPYNASILKCCNQLSPSSNPFFCVILLMDELPRAFTIKLERQKQGGGKIYYQRHKENPEKENKASRRKLCLENMAEFVKWMKSGYANEKHKPSMLHFIPIVAIIQLWLIAIVT